MSDISILDPLEAELRAALAALLPELEGARDQQRAKGVDENLIRHEIARRENLQNEIDGMLQACADARVHWQRLLDAEYPAIPVTDIPAEKYEQFKANEETIALFNAKLRPVEPATGGDVTLGEGALKASEP